MKYKPYKWSEEKRQITIKKHGVDLAEIMNFPIRAHFGEHPNKEKYPRQQAYIIDYNGYPVFVPFVEEEDYIFLKDAIRERKYKYLLE